MSRFQFLLYSLCLTIASYLPASAANPIRGIENGELKIENGFCRIEFDPQNGGLRSVANLLTGDEYLKSATPGLQPFRIYADITKEFEIDSNEHHQLTFDDPAAICRSVLQPNSCRLVDAGRGDALTLRYESDGLEMRLRVVLTKDSGVSDWFLKITNTGKTPRNFLSSFPYLTGVRLGADSKTNLATAMDQGGITVSAWERPGGVLGESNQFSMQWHAIWDPPTHNALGLIFMDPTVLPKRIVLKEPDIDLQYFPPTTLKPGKSIDLPPFRMLVGKGDWKPAARAYHSWFNKSFRTLEPPDWYRRSNGCAGRHFKKGGPGIKADYGGQIALDSFRELPAAHLRCPIDFPEYAFYCSASMSHPVHTDGDNIVRPDMGGAEALRDGIEGVHRLGLHTQLYVEGYIVSKESELARSGKAERWSVMHKDGTITGPYTKQGFYHMCPGCVEWQDHLAGMIGRLLRETGADGVRIDSLGFYYLPCYNPAHKHKDPFGYNEWIKQLLAKANKAAVSVNPNVLLSSEGSADWYAPWVHGALTSRRPRDLSMMRLAMGPYRPYVYAAGALWGSLSGFPGGGCESGELNALDGNWLCARFPAHEALVWGDVADDDPQSSDPQIVTRRFEGTGYWAIVAARPASQDRIWPDGAGLSEQRGEYTITLPGLASQVADAVLCDIENLTWTPLKLETQGNDIQFRLASNWALVILRQPKGLPLAGFDPLPKSHPGDSIKIPLHWIAENQSLKFPNNVTINAPGLQVSRRNVKIPGEAEITVPKDALPGYYGVEVSGKNLLGIKRFLQVE